MHRLSIEDLTREIFKAVDIVRGKMDVSAYSDIISGMLVLKRSSDQPGQLDVPDRANWSYITEHADTAPEQVLNEALKALLWSNHKVLGDTLEDLDFTRRLSRHELRALIHHFDQISLKDDDLMFKDMVGRAYDRILGKFADAAGKKGGEFYTPRSVIQLMVRLVRPQEGQSVYDPFAGSGGMLIHAKEYVAEHSGKQAKLALFGQELNGSMWSIARLNLLFHGIADASVLCGDTLVDPLHMTVDGQRNLFDCALTNPPFSMNYPEREVRFPERMEYGWTPARSKKADLMCVQHVLAMLTPDGVGAVVTPHGVLFRGGTEATIRRGIVEDGRLEAVIGIGANVFHGTGIPACILVLRGVNGPPQSQRGSVLFISAEHELATGRLQNYLEPRHVEKIVATFRNRRDLAGFSRVVSLDEIASNDFNLNIRRYVEASSPYESRLDSRALLFGGVPRTDAQAQEGRFRAFGIDVMKLFRPRDSDYLDFLPEGYVTTAEQIPGLAAASEQDFINHSRRWWQKTVPRIADLTGTKTLLMSRSRFMTSFCEELLPLEILNEHQLIGIFADWWSDRHEDLRGLDYGIFHGVTDNREMPHIDQLEHMLIVLGDDLRSRVERLIAVKRQALVDAYRSWGDQYATSLLDLERQRETAAVRLKSRLKELGYPWPGAGPTES